MLIDLSTVNHTAFFREPAHFSFMAEKVLGWDAAGTVVAVGADVTLFKPGDAVYYAGAIDRSGSNAQLQLVDERIVGRKPSTLDFAQAAAMPLTPITAWELLFDRLGVAAGKSASSGALARRRPSRSASSLARRKPLSPRRKRWSPSIRCASEHVGCS